jgi:sugar lactone lactonase YvrE
VKQGAAPAEDRVFAQSQGEPITAYKLANTLVLGPGSALPETQAVTDGKSVSLSAPQPLGGGQWQVQWQISTDGGSTWTNLADDSTYQGAATSTLTIADAAAALNGAAYRYTSTSSRGSISSNSTTLAVEPQFFPNPASIAIDSSNNLYVGDTSSHTIQKINSSLQISSFVGSRGQAGAMDGTGASARFNQPSGITAAASGDLTVSDTSNATLRSVTAAGVVTTLAGSTTDRGGADGVGSAALFSAPIGIAQNSSGTFYVADSTNHTIRMVTADGTVTTFAGTSGSSGASDGTGAAARFNNPTGVAVDAAGNVFVADTTNNLIRKITPGGVVTTLAGVTGVAGWNDGVGSNALFNGPGGMAVDGDGDLYVADTGNSTIRKITPAGVVTTLAGLPTVGGQKDGTGSNALLNQPRALTIDSAGNLYVADTGNAAIRRVTPDGTVTTLHLTSTGPVITSQPASLTVTAGGSASFSVTATSPIPMTYQWKKDGVDLPGANAAALSIPAAASADAGSYTVVVSNSAGSVTSSAATLTVVASSPVPPTSGGSSGSSGGGAVSGWFFGALALLVGIRRFNPDR